MITNPAIERMKRELDRLESEYKQSLNALSRAMYRDSESDLEFTLSVTISLARKIRALYSQLRKESHSLSIKTSAATDSRMKQLNAMRQDRGPHTDWMSLPDGQMRDILRSH